MLYHTITAWAMAKATMGPDCQTQTKINAVSMMISQDQDVFNVYLASGLLIFDVVYK